VFRVLSAPIIRSTIKIADEVIGTVNLLLSAKKMSRTIKI
jgi:hypothetical protein